MNVNPDDLARWVQEQRWFAGRGRTLERVTRTEIATLNADPLVRVDALELHYADGGSHIYQVPVAYRGAAPPELAHALIGHGEPAPDGSPRFAYDAMHDKAASRLWLAGMAGELTGDGLRFRRTDDAEFPADTDSIPLAGEQSNSTLVFGESTILKVFRRLADGRNPDAELLDALRAARNPYVPRLLGWVEGCWTTSTGGDIRATLAVATEFLAMASSGWDLALASVRGLLADPGNDPAAAGGDFAGEAARLGEATAAVHSDLARVLGNARVGADEVADELTERFKAALGAVGELEQHAGAILASYDGLRERPTPIAVQRVHGDLHLGQVLRVPAGWRLLDFEGEPGTPTAARRALQSPLKDVAGMLRSFDYAAQYLLAGVSSGGGAAPDAVSTACAQAWVERNEQAFLAGYGAVVGAEVIDRVILHAFMLDKAVYEVVHEARRRQDWVAIPLGGLGRLLPADTPAHI